MYINCEQQRHSQAALVRIVEANRAEILRPFENLIFSESSIIFIPEDKYGVQKAILVKAGLKETKNSPLDCSLYTYFTFCASWMALLL